MATADIGDPFRWDVDAVCKHLCAAGSPWTNNVEALEERIRDEDIDGETLLTADITMSRQELMEFLNLRTAKHKSKMALEIKRLRAESDGFNDWKKHNEKFVHENSKQDDAMREDGPRSPPWPMPELPAQAPKRRKIAPTLVSEVGASIQGQALNSEDFNVPDPHSVPVIVVDRSASTALSTCHIPKELSLGAVNFRHLHNFSFHSGTDLSLPWRRRIYRETLKSMRKHHMRQELMRRGEVARESCESSDPSEQFDEDEVNDLDQMDVELDEQTRMEMMEEDQDRVAENQEGDEPHILDPDDVRQILEDTIAEMKIKWNTTKKQKAEHAAYNAWNRARSKPGLKDVASQAQRNCRHFEKQLARSCEEIVKGEWKDEVDVRFQAKVLETTVASLSKANLIYATIQLRDRPPTPSPMPKSQTKPRRKQTVGEEDISADSSDNDFIVPDTDDPATPAQTAQNSLRSTNVVVLEKHQDVIGLVTPTKQTSQYEIKPVSSVRDIDATDKPIGRDIICESLKDSDVFTKVASEKPITWQKKKDRWKLLVSLLWRLRCDEREEIFEVCRGSDINAIWEVTLEHVFARSSKNNWKGTNDEDDRMPVHFVSIFWSFWKCKIYKPTRIKTLNDKAKQRALSVKDNLFRQFCELLPRLKPCFPYKDLVLDHGSLLGGLDDIEDEHGWRQKARKSGKDILQDAAAKEMQEKDHQRAKELEDKKLKFRAQLGQTGVMPLDRSKIIINESKRDDQACIYINEYIGEKIKMHQLNGVRFLWNQIVTDTEQGQGCLLSHTMGLGKTMQAITLLVTIRECAASKDIAISSQIPRDLKPLRPIILCPAGLINNWVSEIQQWDRSGVLSPITKVDPQVPPYHRRSAIYDWSRRGGTLIMGYELFMSLEGDSRPGMRDMLTKSPNLVVVDEAHNLKNRQSQKSIACSGFLTKRRVALTGSPLANNVEEYYSMIEWIAPGFLGPIEQFKTFFAGPIHQGLWTDSTNLERRKALSLLEALTLMVAPKVNRASISDFKKDLPEKLEFVISVVPTDMQRKLYSIYMDGLLGDVPDGDKVPQAKVFGALSLLGHICNHPQCFRDKTLEVKSNEDSIDGEGELRCYPYSIIPKVLKETDAMRDMDDGLSRKIDLLRIILNEARKSKEKVLLFSQSITTLTYLKRLFKRENRTWSFLDGSTPTAKRQQEVAEFNAGTNQIYLISTTAGGVGLNIQSATRVVIFDQRWNPVHEQQAIARAYRMGQRRRVVVYRFVTAGTFEEDLQNKAVFKQQLASRVVDQKAPSSWSKQLGNVVHHIRDNDPEDLSGFLGKDRALDQIIGHSFLHSSVQSILSADTFEEEDPTDELTEEEKKHAAKIAEVGRERITQPEKYNGIMSSLILKYNDSDVDAENSSALMELDKLIAPPIAPEEGEADKSPMSPNSLAARPGWMQTYPGADTLCKAPAINNEDAQQANLLQPILGANTFISGAVDSPRLQLTARGAPPNDSNIFDISSQAQSTSRQSALAALVSKSTLSQSSVSNKDAFERAILAQFNIVKGDLSLDEIHSANSSIKSVAREIAEIRTEQNFGFVYNSRRWKILTDMVHSHERFVLAIAMRTIQPTYLATSDEKSLEGKISSINTISWERFVEEFIKGKRPEMPRVMHTIPSLNLINSPPSNDVKPERGKTQFRLPKWASEALNEEGED